MKKFLLGLMSACCVLALTYDASAATKFSRKVSKNNNVTAAAGVKFPTYVPTVVGNENGNGNTNPDPSTGGGSGGAGDLARTLPCGNQGPYTQCASLRRGLNSQPGDFTDRAVAITLSHLCAKVMDYLAARFDTDPARGYHYSSGFIAAKYIPTGQEFTQINSSWTDRQVAADRNTLPHNDTLPAGKYYCKSALEDELGGIKDGRSEEQILRDAGYTEAEITLRNQRLRDGDIVYIDNDNFDCKGMCFVRNY